MKTFILLSFLFAIRVDASQTNIVRIYKQWHLLPKVNTLDIEKSKSLSQYKNQSFIYTDLDNLIKNGEVKSVISEGCEGEIDKSFSSTYNGWNYRNLEENKDKKNFSNIVTLVPLKLEVKYTNKLFTICGDNLDLIKKNSLASSDLNGYVGYLTRLSQYKNKDKKKFNMYKDALLKDIEDKKQDPIEFARLKAKESLSSFEKYTFKRNVYFVNAIIKNIKMNPAVVIGGIHLPNLKKQLKEKNIKFKVVDVEGYPDDTDEIFNQIRLILN